MQQHTKYLPFRNTATPTPTPTLPHMYTHSPPWVRHLLHTPLDMMCYPCPLFLQKINEKPSVVMDYEAGRAIPNQQLLAKMERALGGSIYYITLVRYS